MQPMLDTARDTSLLFQFASVLACGHAPYRSGSHQDGQDHSSEETYWRGAWHRRRGRSRRLVARTMAKQMAVRVEAATAPFQYALTTKAGCESVAHILQSMTDQDERATIVSIDGVGAYDLSRVDWVAPWTERGRRKPCSTQTWLAETCSASHTRRQSGTDSVADFDEP